MAQQPLPRASHCVERKPLREAAGGNEGRHAPVQHVMIEHSFYHTMINFAPGYGAYILTCNKLFIHHMDSKQSGRFNRLSLLPPVCQVMNFNTPLTVPQGCWHVLSLQLLSRALPVNQVSTLSLNTSLGTALQVPLYFHPNPSKVK